jgi:hypothetical protein
MLENSTLLLRPAANSAGWQVLAGKTMVVVGLARWRVPSRGTWWRALCPRVLEVREMEDEPLLFTLRRSWTLLPWFEVRDADEHAVGRFLDPVIEDRNGCPCAMRYEDGPGKEIFLNPLGVCLAQLTREGQVARLDFEDVIEKEPFLKMLFLAAALLR